MEQSERTPLHGVRGDDSDQHEGFGAAGWAILSTLLVIGFLVGLYSAYALR